MAPLKERCSSSCTGFQGPWSVFSGVYLLPRPLQFDTGLNTPPKLPVQGGIAQHVISAHFHRQKVSNKTNTQRSFVQSFDTKEQKGLESSADLKPQMHQRSHHALKETLPELIPSYRILYLIVICLKTIGNITTLLATQKLC